MPNKNPPKILHDVQLQPKINVRFGLIRTGKSKNGISLNEFKNNFKILNSYVYTNALDSEEHSKVLPEMWYERRWRKSAERYALRHYEIPQMELDLLTAAVQNLEASSRKRILDAFQQLEQDQMKNTIESYENEMMSVTTNTGIEKIPQPTRMRKTLYDDSMFPLESWWNKIIKQNGPYAKELETLTSELKVLRTKLEDWKIDLREHNFMPKSPCWSKIEYKCEKCKVGINPECLNCKDEYNELEKIKNENTRIVYPLLCVDLPVCNACVTKWGKEAIQQCL